MSREEVQASIGKMVMSHDAENHPSRHSDFCRVVWMALHGPYKIVRLTKQGMVELDRHGECMVKPSLLKRI